MDERYELREKLAQGGRGTVYLAYDRVLRREVAVKRLLISGSASGAADAEALIREALTLSQLQHPNIVQVFDTGTDDEGTYVVMELLEGQDLDTVVGKGADAKPLSMTDFATLTKQCLDALVTAGSLNLMHRDIKPANIVITRLVTGGLQAKVVDFGLAKISASPSLQTLDQTQGIVGSIYFMAPEQFKRRPLDARTDLYALGCTLYYAITGSYPFFDTTLKTIMEAHLAGSYPPPEERRLDLPSGVVAWMKRMMARDVEKRPENAAMALHEFEALGWNGTTTSKRPPSSTVPVGKGSSSDSKGARISGATIVAHPEPKRTTGHTPPASSDKKAPTAGNSTASIPPAPPPRAHRWIVLGAVSVALVLTAFFLTRSDSGPPQPPPLATPAVSGSPLEFYRLPREDRLVWRFVGGFESWNRGTDGHGNRQEAKNQTIVHAWRNISPLVENAFCTPAGSDVNKSAKVWTLTFPGSEIPFYYHFFSYDCGMQAGIDPGIAPGFAQVTDGGSRGATVAMVWKPGGTPKPEISMRPLLLNATREKDAISIHMNPDTGTVLARVVRGNHPVETQVQHDDLKQRKGKGRTNWHVCLASWDGVHGRLAFTVRTESGAVLHAKDVLLPPGIGSLDWLHLGFVPPRSGSKVALEDNASADIVEVAVFNQALPQETQDELLSTLWSRYFRKPAHSK